MALLVNTRNANAFTGKKGYTGLKEIAEELANQLSSKQKLDEEKPEKIKIKDIIFGCTGTIGETFPTEKIKKSKLFSEGVNISVVKVNSKDAISVLTYERGVGITQACGTGACASVVASNKLNLVEKKVTVTMSGGLLEVEICHDHNILMVGKADIVFEGEIDLSRLM